MTVSVHVRKSKSYSFGYCFIAAFEHQFKRQLPSSYTASVYEIKEIKEASQVLCLFPTFLPDIFQSSDHQKFWNIHINRLDKLLETIKEVNANFVDVNNRYATTGL